MTASIACAACCSRSTRRGLPRRRRQSGRVCRHHTGSGKAKWPVFEGLLGYHIAVVRDRPFPLQTGPMAVNHDQLLTAIYPPFRTSPLAYPPSGSGSPASSAGHKSRGTTLWFISDHRLLSSARRDLAHRHLAGPAPLFNHALLTHVSTACAQGPKLSRRSNNKGRICLTTMPSCGSITLKHM